MEAKARRWGLPEGTLRTVLLLALVLGPFVYAMWFEYVRSH